jgi:hypothetical protein
VRAEYWEVSKFNWWSYIPTFVNERDGLWVLKNLIPLIDVTFSTPTPVHNS